MKLRGAVAVVLLAIPVVAVAPADAASTRAEYIAQVDPICQSFVDPANVAVNRELQSFDKWLRNGGISGKGKAWKRATRRLAGSLKGLAQIRASLTAQIAAVPPPPDDAETVGRWLDARRQSEALATSAALALRTFKIRLFNKRFLAAATAYVTSGRAISGFGFQVCGVAPL
jgi:hypothetical protein